MQPGDLNEQIVIQSYTMTTKTTGERVESWSTFATVWANVKERAGREFFNSDTTVADAAAIFTIYYRVDITRKMRISYRGQYWGIESIREMKDANKMHLSELVAVAQVAE
jgi:SPP1 family predicted phage head-tail adaptor